MPVSADTRIGSELLGYRIEAPIGRGGMSVVYRAADLRLKRNVALKLLASELAADDRNELPVQGGAAVFGQHRAGCAGSTRMANVAVGAVGLSYRNCGDGDRENEREAAPVRRVPG